MFASSMLKERLDYLSNLCPENNIPKILYYDKVIKKYEAKKNRKKSITKVCQQK